MTVLEIKALRERTWLFLEPSVAACAGMSLAELQRFLWNSLSPPPTNEQLEALARRMSLKLPRPPAAKYYATLCAPVHRIATSARWRVI
jgi:hypothetical protein